MGCCSPRTCCCGLCSLKTGCVIIGSIQIVLGLFIGIFASQYVGYFFGVLWDFIDSLVGILILELIFAAVTLLLGIILIHGARKESPGFLNAWFYTTLVIVIIEILNPVLGFVLGYHWIDCLSGFIFSLVFIPFLIFVRSYFHELRGDRVPTSA